MCFVLHCYCFFTIRFEWKPPEPQFATYVKICAKYARAKKRTKNFRKSTWHLWSFVSHWSARQCRRQSQQIPKTGRRRRSSFVVRCSSFVVYRRLVSLVSCSLVGLVVCLAHNTIAAMCPLLAHPPLFRWLRLCCSSLTSLAPPLAPLSAASVTFSMPSKQLLSVCLLLLLLLFFCCFLAAAAANGILATAALPYAVTPLQITVLT